MDPNATSTEPKTVTEVTIDMPSLPEDEPGYHRLASLMGGFPEAAPFRRFATLNAKNLLYLQAELTALERELRDAARKDAQSGNQFRENYSRAWVFLCHSDERPDGSPEQWKVFSKIREALREYSL